jgi:hypothetical protein
VGRRNGCKSGQASEHRRTNLVLRMLPAVHEDNGSILAACGARNAECFSEVRFVQRRQFLTRYTGSGSAFDDLFVQRLRQIYPATE